jgi:uncharacterized protein (DUF2336 family)
MEDAMAKRMLTEADVQRLMTSPSGDVRAETATKVAQAFDAGTLSASERELASAIFRAMVKDAEVMVREALAHNLKSNPDLPKDVALSLAKDIEQVSLPVLEYSMVLTDADLIDIVQVASAEKQTAIARRAEVSGAVAEALVDHSRHPSVVTALVGNPGAKLEAPLIEKVIAKHGDILAVKNTLARRADLPVKIAERLVAAVSETLRRRRGRSGAPAQGPSAPDAEPHPARALPRRCRLLRGQHGGTLQHLDRQCPRADP